MLSSGSIEVEPVLQWDFRAKFWEIEYIRFALGTRKKVEITLESKAEATAFEAERELARYYQAPS